MSGSANLFQARHNSQSCMGFELASRECFLHQIEEDMSAMAI
ncbi:hypothetical protein NBRC3257_1909 [Gluconobacter thailandicus NBRC 3257]|uniref:Uncharacterized protein n=1 Tax=Gluconobacter thailandicus NBRC 3257 TaxID=1381097 RepID=A0ABQ0IXH6_GLUTH|nr:hypothetical protein B932_0443 [Gluconobacter oxydans H24]GAC88677.1 hypothetical protein NBRC3255_2338 [Gluconobacter thailandicus NBRC 3255]GAD26910.1 hypothetical protein NBRC3257_1909 [Gluconobacter thailandicus NBRC 3257]